MVRWMACVLTAACFTLAGCTSDSRHPAAPSERLDCTSNGRQTTLHEWRTSRVVLGVVALPASPAAAALQTGRIGVTGQPRLFAKSPLVVRAGASFELRTPRAQSSSLMFSWRSGVADPTRRLVVRKCRSTGNAPWLAFVGGYYLNRAACATVIVQTSTAQRRVMIGIGAPCVGQQPPAPPSQR
jgi:hypothetical protein